MIGGYVAAGLLGVLTMADMARAMEAPIVGLPAIGYAGWSFEASLVIPFAIGALASCLKTVGDLTTAQKINDADWVRPDLRNIGRGTLANGIGSALAGFFGTVGMNASSANIGVSGATGVTSRRIGYATGILFVVLAFLPKLSGALAAMPRSVMGAALIFVAAFIFVNGLQIVASRLLDARRTFVIGLSFIFAMAVDIVPQYFRSLPADVQPLVSNSLVAGMICAVWLNSLFRIGARKVRSMVISPGDPDYAALEQFIEACGADWGARRDVVMRAKHNIQQTIDTIRSSGVARGPLDLQVSFDDFDVEVLVTYQGSVLELPETRPTMDEVLDTAAGERRLAGYMLRQLADKVTATQKEGRSTLVFKFVH
jgi:NCS2 family nucleobase:cation symporter-2